MNPGDFNATLMTPGETGARVVDAPAPPMPRLCRLQHALTLSAWALLIGTLLGFAGRWFWIAGLASPFRLQWLMGAVLVLAGMLIGRRLFCWRVGLGWLPAVIALAINVFCAAPLWRPIDRSIADSDTLTILAFNPNYGNHALDEASSIQPIASMIEHSGAQVVVICEITQHRLGVLAKALPDYRLAAGVGRADPFGIAIFVSRAAETGDDATRLNVGSGQVLDVTQGVAWAPQAQVLGRWRGREFAVLALHTISAVHDRSDRMRVPMMAGAAAWAKEQQRQGRAAIVAGDFNATPWCAPFIDMLETGDLINSQVGFGFQGSWPAPLPPMLRIPIDHCVHSADLVTLRREILGNAFGLREVVVHQPILAFQRRRACERPRCLHLRGQPVCERQAHADAR